MMQSALKDLWPRYKTMRGFRVLRKAGWDTHGLPIELTAEKELGFKSKRDIENYGVEKYIEYCRSTVFRYKKTWEDAIHRIGRFLDTDNDYATLTKDYIQTDWWALKQAWDKGLLYQDRRIMPYCARCGTSLSQHETAQGYKDVKDWSLYVKFPLVGREKTYLVAWTTTPWTLLSNVALAVNPDLVYVTVEIANGERLILAEARLEAVKAMLGEYKVVERSYGKDLNALLYRPLFEFQVKYSDRLIPQGGWEQDVVYDPVALGNYAENFNGDFPAHNRWDINFRRPFKVIADNADNYVTADDGSGIVHLALYGVDDFRLIRENKLPDVQNVDMDGKVVSIKNQNGVESNPFAGRWFREEGLDVDILKDLAGRGLLFGKEKITHSYPHCYRCDTPLMYYAMSGWFLRTSSFKDQMLAANKEINWYPEHIKEGRFGNWLENNVDWNISRARYWGSPLPIWSCGGCGHQVCVESLADLEGRLKSALPEGFDPHKPYIDAVELPCEKCGKSMKREPEVLDSWFNAGIMPWGQWGYPAARDSVKLFNKQFPADFICEAIDQTRGWFYTLLATSTLLTMDQTSAADPPRSAAETPFSGLSATRVGRASQPDSDGQDAQPDSDGQDARPTRFTGGKSSFKNVICTELINDAEGKKMSKSRGNVIDPIALCEKYGADAVRWTFYSVNPWTARRFAESDLAEALKQVLIPYWNAYSFFVTYARVDGWRPSRVGRASQPDLSEVAGTEPRPTELSGWEARPTRPNPLDRWILSRLVWLDETVRNALDGYDVTSAAQAFAEYLDELTNWYIRRSRRRFWKSEDDDDKQWAYNVLYQVLTSMNRMLAPFLPFVSEAVYQNLERSFDASLSDSVHLARWPEIDPRMRDFNLENRMDSVRKTVSLARSLRAENRVRTRQPLYELVVPGMPDYFKEFDDLILDELNIKKLRRIEDANEIVTWSAKADYKSIGPKFGSRAKDIAVAIADLDHHSVVKLSTTGEIEILNERIRREDVVIAQNPIAGFWVRSEGGLTVALSNQIDNELISEWLAREFIHHIQNMRRDAGLEVTDRIAIDFCGDRELRDAIVHHIRYIAGETLAESIVTTLESGAAEVRIGDKVCRVQIRPFN